MDSPAIIEALRRQSHRVEAHLKACEALFSQHSELHARLVAMRAEMLEHLDARAAFYLRLLALCRAFPAEHQRARSYEEAMRAESVTVREFFAALDLPQSPLLAHAFKTVALLTRRGAAAEETAVFPLYLRRCPA